MDQSLDQSSSERFHPAADGNKCRDTQPNTKRFWEPHRRRRGRIVGSRGVEDALRTWPTESAQQGITETEATIMELVRVCPRQEGTSFTKLSSGTISSLWCTPNK